MEDLQHLRTNLADLSETVAQIGSGYDRIAAEIQALKDQIAQGGVITQEELDGLGETVVGIKAGALETLNKVQGL